MSSSLPGCEASFSEMLNLNGHWRLRWNDGERGERPDRVVGDGVDWSRGWEARVPGCVHSTLIEAGIIPEPGLGTNVLACRWVEETIWIYRRTFSCAAVPEGGRAWLRFEQLDLSARIFLNGRLVGEHANQFRPFQAEVSEWLVAGENEVIVEVESGLHLTRDRSAAGLGVKANYLLTKMPWMRKTHNQHGWDWAPRLLNVGIPGKVSLEVVRGPRWQDVSVSAEVSDDLRGGTVCARIFVDMPSSGTAEAVLRLHGKEYLASADLEAGPGTVDITGLIEDPELWWPVGHGGQPLYDVEVELHSNGQRIGSATRRVGFRRVRFLQDPHPSGGRFFTLEINGRRIFCKGANYVPSDLLLSRINRETHASNIALALEAHFNFLRVWGGGQYESDDFYELCDEKGLLVWQDFIFACAKYPATDEGFLANVREEVRHQVRRLRCHASLIAWCGNNEMEWAAWDWGFEEGICHPDHSLFHLVIPRLLREEDPSRYYQPSSPWSPHGENPNSDFSGDQHAWQIGFGEGDFRKFRERECRFPTEWGFLGPNSLPAVRAALSSGPEKAGTFAWELHDNALSSWDSIPPYSPDRILQEWTGIPISAMSIEDYVFFAGIVQGCALAEAIRNFRRRMFTCSAAVFWMLNEIWPTVRSWGIVDSLGNRCPSFWPVRRAFTPVTVAVVREEKIVRIYGINDGPDWRGELHFGLACVEGGMVGEQRSAVQIPGNSSTLLGEYPAELWDAAGISTHVAFARLLREDREAARETLILPLFREMEWAYPEVTVEHINGKAVFRSETFAWRVCLDIGGRDPLPDNFFDILPGIPVELDWPATLPRPSILHVGNEMQHRQTK